MDTDSDYLSKLLTPGLREKIINFKNTPRPPDSRTAAEKEQSRSYLRQRISDFKIHKNNENIQLQNIIQEQARLLEKQKATIKKQNDELRRMKHLIESRLGEPLKTINRESPSAKFFNSSTKSKKTGGRKHGKTAKKHK